MPGSSGRTCSCPAASSSTSKTFFPAAWSRQRPARASIPGGIWLAGTPAVSSKLASASAGSTGRCPGVWACNGKKNCPSGKRPAEPVRGVHREGGLADPGHPADRVHRHHPAAIRRGRRRPPRHQLPELGLAAGEGGDVPRQRPAGRRRPRPGLCRAAAASASPAGARPRAAATNSSRAGPSRPSAPASSTAVSLRAVALMPALQVADRPLAHLRGLGQLVLGQPGLVPQLPQQPAETQRGLLGRRPIDHWPVAPSARPAPAPDPGCGAGPALTPSLILCLSCARLRMVTTRPGR